jgi:NAD(P)-dependent dehydrogenase (short-subunit alcohol dehydrogenase family)
MELQGKVAVVTGGAHRVGKSIALAMAQAGAHLVVHYHSSSEAETTLGELRAHGVRAVGVDADLGDAAGASEVFEAAEREFGGVDVLINSASTFQKADVLTLSPEDWQHTLAVNLSAPFYCAQLAAQSMLARGGGAIINLSDLSGLQPWARYPAHSVSKAGLLMLTRVLAKALAPTIRVNAIALGPVMKPPDWDEARWNTVGSHTLLKRTGSGYDVARTVLFLLQEDFMTGSTVIVDGGRSIT